MLPLPSLLTLPSRRTVAVALTAVAASVALGACTSQDGAAANLDGEQGRVQDAVTLFSDRASDDAAGTICNDSLTPAARDAIAKGGDCAAAVQKIIDGTDLTSLNVDTVEITGNSAVATIVKSKRATDQTQLVLERTGDQAPWKIAAFGNAAAKAVESSTPESTTPAETTPASTPDAKS